MPANPLRSLPSVSKVLDHPALAQARAEYPHNALIAAIRAEIELLRQQLLADHATPELELMVFCQQVQLRVASNSALQLRPVINATGIVLHTNLGRSPMHELAAKAAYDAARGYLNLELSLETGKRSSRQDPIRSGLLHLTGAEAATVVNNCAGATIIVLRALALGKEVIVSRGQLVEIGGSFRIPDIMTVSGAVLREVGTTNITRIGDYEAAIGPQTAMLMRVHCSNYRIRGFTKSASLEELVALGRKHDIPVIDDAGSGATIELSPFGLPGEPSVREGLDAGADLVLFSGDKLLGGPQAGLIAGKKTLVDRIERDPLMRALRLDKMTLAALEATLNLHRDPGRARQEIPTLRMLTTPLSELRARCTALVDRLSELAGIKTVQIVEDVAYVGGGSLPDVAIPTCVISISLHSISEEQFASQLRTGKPAVVARVQNGQVLFDLRTVFPDQETELFKRIQQIQQP